MLLELVISILTFVFVSAQIATKLRPQPSPLHAPETSTCCGLKDAELVACLDRAGLLIESNVRRSWNSSQYSGQLKFGIVSIATPSLWNYSAYSWAVTLAYCEHHSLICRSLHDSESFGVKDPRWAKVAALQQALAGGELDWVMWLDADAALLDLSMRLDLVVAAHPTAHLVTSAGSAVNCFYSHTNYHTH